MPEAEIIFEDMVAQEAAGLVNPYCTLGELMQELKNDGSNVASEKRQAFLGELRAAVNNASRWIDRHLSRDFFYHVHTDEPTAAGYLESRPVEPYALLFDDHSRAIYREKLFLNYRPVVRMDEIAVMSVNSEGAIQKWQVLQQSYDFTVAYDMSSVNEDYCVVKRLAGPWYYYWPQAYPMGTRTWAVSRPAAILQVRGLFGYPQPTLRPATASAGGSTQASGWRLDSAKALPTGLQLWWTIEADEGVETCTVSVYLDAAHSTLVAQGSGGQGAENAPASLTLKSQSVHGICGTVNVIYTEDDDETTNIIIIGPVIVDRTQVPAGIPGHITLATRLVAAALSGHNRKEVAGMDGQKQSILSNEIPKTVYKLLGNKQTPVVI